MGQTIKIKWDTKLLQKKDNVGEAHYRTNEIVIQPNMSGFLRTLEQIEHTFLHELIHFIFFMLGERELGNNEKLIEQMSGLFHQAFKTAQYNDQDCNIQDYNNEKIRSD